MIRDRFMTNTPRDSDGNERSRTEAEAETKAGHQSEIDTDVGPPSRTDTTPLEERPSDLQLIGDRGTAPGEDPGEEIIATLGFFAVWGLFLFTTTGVMLRALNANQMWTTVLCFLVSSFIYFSSGIEAPGGGRTADDQPSPLQYATANALAILHSTVYGLLAFAVFIVADTSFLPPVPLSDRFKLTVALYTFLTAGMLLWILFAVIHGRGLPRGVIRVFRWLSRGVTQVIRWCRRRLSRT